MKSLFIISLSLIPFCMCPAELFLNSDMSMSTFGATDNNLVGTHEDQGWITKSTALWSLTENSGKLTLLSDAEATHWMATNATRYAVGQAVSVSGTGSKLNLKFDWTAAAAATGDALKINYQLVGWQGTTTPPLITERFFTGLNFRSTQVRDVGSSTGKVDLRNGTHMGTGNQTVSEGVLTGTAGITVSEDLTIDLSAFGAGDQDLSDYDYIGIKFVLGTDVIDGGGNLVDGSMLDNVSLTVSNAEPSSPIISHDTGYTITKVRTAEVGTNTFIVGSSYEGTVLGLNYDGTALWTNELSGYLNHDLWCGDLTGNGTNEILTANADGNVYCLNAEGILQWQFNTNSAPMFSVCVVNDTNGTAYAVCGGYDNKIYYLDASGNVVKTVDSATYSKETTWGQPKPPQYVHIANFVRPVNVNGEEKLVLMGENNSQQRNGSVYFFNVLADGPFQTNTVSINKGAGDFRVTAPPGGGTHEILIGDSGGRQNIFARLEPAGGIQTNIDISTEYNLGFGYRVVQTEIIPDEGSYLYLALIGSDLILVPADFDLSSSERLQTTYSYNDMWKDPSNNILLASAQSGGSCIHIIDTLNPGWKSAYQSLNPPGKIAQILANTAAARSNLNASFIKPAWERNPLPVYLMTEGTSGVEDLVDSLTTTYPDSPVFLGNDYTSHAHDPADWNRDTVLAANPKYRDARDSRRTYDWTYSQARSFILSMFSGHPGAAYWGGHGNDPYMFSKELTKDIMDTAGSKKTVLIYPEIGDTSTNLNFLTDDLIYPLADHSLATGTNANLYIRSKQHFWSADIYHSGWARLVAGDYADIFVAALEETNSKTMELSLAGRMGLWASGSINQWGSRCSRDNTSLNRLREFSHQNLPNHFLRQMVYNVSCGAQYLNNFSVDQEYISLYWELIAKGAIYVPKREEIVSFSPVHLSVSNPDEHYLEEGGEVKWIAKYDEAFEIANPMVFSRMNGSWPYALVTEWDFSRYAAGVKDRGLHFLPPYNNGIVLLTPAQQGVFADTNAVRGSITDHLHPLYKSIMQEFHTDGRHYYAADSNTVYGADTYYTTVSNAIAAAKTKLPLTVDGNVAWVCAQTSPTHLRLTMVDSGYINPKARTATVTFNTVTPTSMTDLLDGSSYSTAGGTTTVEVPLGLFRFIDIELAEPFFPDNGWGEFSSDHGLSGNSQADFDEDGETDLYEYGLGGDPTNPAVQAARPYIQYGTDDIARFHNLQVKHANPGITYVTEWTEDLVNGPWNGSWETLTRTASTDPDYDDVERQVYGGTNDHLYFQVNVLGL